MCAPVLLSKPASRQGRVHDTTHSKQLRRSLDLHHHHRFHSCSIPSEPLTSVSLTDLWRAPSSTPTHHRLIGQRCLQISPQEEGVVPTRPVATNGFASTSPDLDMPHAHIIRTQFPHTGSHHIAVRLRKRRRSSSSCYRPTRSYLARAEADT